MAKCAACGTTVLFGGKKLDGLRFCNNKCLSKGQLAIAADQIPDELVATQAREIHAGACPVCQENRGPVDVHTSHKVASFLVMTWSSSTPRVSCGACGTKAKLGALVYSLLLGWWGIPWGLIMTPVQISKNVAALLRSDESLNPSVELEQLVRANIASQHVNANQQALQ